MNENKKSQEPKKSWPGKTHKRGRRDRQGNGTGYDLLGHSASPKDNAELLKRGNCKMQSRENTEEWEAAREKAEGRKLCNKRRMGGITEEEEETATGRHGGAAPCIDSSLHYSGYQFHDVLQAFNCLYSCLWQAQTISHLHHQFLS